MWRSITDYLKAMGVWLYILIVQEGASVIGMSDAFDTPIPRWAWGALGILGLVVAPFIAFHKQRIHNASSLQSLHDAVSAEKKRADDAVARLNDRQLDKVANLLDEGLRWLSNSDRSETDVPGWYLRVIAVLEVILPDKVAFFNSVEDEEYEHVELYARCQKLKEILQQAHGVPVSVPSVGVEGGQATSAA